MYCAEKLVSCVYGITLDSLRLETERANLVYVLSHEELIEEASSELADRLAFVEDELLRLFIHRLPASARAHR